MYNNNIVYTIVKQNDVYYLQPFTDAFIVPKKVYGGLDKLMYRFWTTFVVRPGSLGIILTGPLGSGKSQLAEMIGNLGIVNKFKVVLVTDIAADIELVKFIDGLDRTVIIFDEFGKNFNHQLQDKMLTMFNDLSNKKKLFILTENDENSISGFIRNRPGRALYHVSFKRIKKNVIEEYCKDKNVDFTSEFYTTLNKVHDKALVFSFDHLKALVEEHLAYPNETFEELLEVLNLDILTKEENLAIVSFKDISDPNNIKTVELENPDYRVEKKAFELGRQFWVYPKDGGGSICIKPEDVSLIEENRMTCIINNKYEVILEVR